MIDVYFGTGNGALPLCATRPSSVIRVYAWADSQSRCWEGGARSHRHLRRVYYTTHDAEGGAAAAATTVPGRSQGGEIGAFTSFPGQILLENLVNTKAGGLGGADSSVTTAASHSTRLCEQGPVRRGPSRARTRCCFLARHIHRGAGTLDIGARHPCYFGR